MQHENRSAVVLQLPVKCKPRPEPAPAPARDPFAPDLDSASREGVWAWKLGYKREESRYLTPGGRAYPGCRLLHLAWLKGWDAANALHLIESSGRRPRKPKKAASA